MLFIVFCVAAHVLCAVERPALNVEESSVWSFEEDGQRMCVPLLSAGVLNLVEDVSSFYWRILREGVFPVKGFCIYKPVSQCSILACYEQKTLSQSGRLTLRADSHERFSMTVGNGVVSFAYCNASWVQKRTQKCKKSFHVDKAVDGDPETVCVCFGNEEKATVMWFDCDYQDNTIGYFMGGSVKYEALTHPKFIWGVANYNDASVPTIGGVFCQYEEPCVLVENVTLESLAMKDALALERRKMQRALSFWNYPSAHSSAC